VFKRWLDIPKGKSLLLLGPRRAGKTTLLRTLYPELKYISLDDIDYLSWAKRDPKGLLGSLGPEVIIDEVQRCPELTVTIKYFIDRGELRVLMTGSSSLGLLDASADTLAGRMQILHLPPACWGEQDGPLTHRFFDDQLNPVQIAHARRRFADALSFGGFPEVLLQPGNLEKAEILKNYRDTYFLRDLSQLAHIENVEAMLAVFHHLVRSIGSPLSVANFAQEAGLSHPTAKRYLNIITQSELGFRLYGAHFGPAKRYVRAGKLYLADNGIIKGLGQAVARGQLVENFVVCELEKRRKLMGAAAPEFVYYRAQSGAEVDLVIEEEERILALEIKSSEKIGARDLRRVRDYAAAKQRKPVRPYVIYLGDEYREIEGIRCVPAYALHRAGI
jgi:uncharacterized protein